MHSATVLLLQADTGLRQFITQILTTQGFEVVGVASNGREGIELIHKLQPNLIVLDVILEELDGFGVMSEIAQQNSMNTCKFLVYTALSPHIVRQQLASVSLTVNDVIMKEVDFTPMLQALFAAS